MGEDRLVSLSYAAPPAPPARGWTLLLAAIGVSTGALVVGTAMFAVRSATAPQPAPGGTGGGVGARAAARPWTVPVAAASASAAATQPASPAASADGGGRR